MTIPHTEQQTRLFETILRLETPAECAAFFEDLCTTKELTDLSMRLEVASLLRQGLNYQQVGRRTGVSSATICRVKKCLENGAGGYRRVLERAEEDGHEP